LGEKGPTGDAHWLVLGVHQFGLERSDRHQRWGRGGDAPRPTWLLGGRGVSSCGPHPGPRFGRDAPRWILRSLTNLASGGPWSLGSPGRQFGPDPGVFARIPPPDEADLVRWPSPPS
jgi:hypothetical protein